MAESARRPNVLIYCTDQQRADLLGCAGHPRIRTPHLDALAARGVRLDRLYVQGTVCMPSRSSILTGRYPSAHGVTDNGYELPESETTVADLFRAAGYHTACVGRTHVTCTLPHPALPRADYHGFAECRHTQSYWAGIEPRGEYQEWLRAQHPEVYETAIMRRPVDRPDAHCASWWDLPEHLSMTAWVTDASLEVLRRHRETNAGQPVFLWAGTWDPHFRFCVPPPWDRMYPPEEIPLPVRREGEIAALPPHYARLAMTASPKEGYALDEVIRNSLSIYWGMISHVDDQFGRLMRGLEALGMAEDTVVLFLSDHGEMAGDHWLWAKGAIWFDGSLRVPGILAGPSLPAGRATDALVETIDLLPTLCDLAGIDVPPLVQGRGCLPLLRGETETHREDVYTEFQDHQFGETMHALRTDRYRIVHYHGRPYGELYDLHLDPDALYNRWGDPAYQAPKRALQARLLDRLMANLARPDTRVAPF